MVFIAEDKFWVTRMSFWLKVLDYLNMKFVQHSGIFYFGAQHDPAILSGMSTLQFTHRSMEALITASGHHITSRLVPIFASCHFRL